MTDEVVVSIGPGLALLVALALALVAYRAQRALRGPFEDRETTTRGATPLIPMGVRQFVAWLSAPFVKALVRAGVSADAITMFSIVLAVAAAAAAASGRFALGGWLYLATGMCDFFDGRVARASRSAGLRGAVLDSVVDRYAEGAILIGLAWAYRAEPTLLVALLALAGSFLVPYVRARAEAAGAALSHVGIMQRPERVLLLGATLALSPIAELLVPAREGWPHHALAASGLAVLALTSNVTALQRFVHVLRVLGASPAASPTDESAAATDGEPASHSPGAR